MRTRGGGDAIDVLYVGGMPRSGSTLADLMLDGLPGHVAVGELFYLWRNGLQHDGLCSCAQPFSRCGFWAEVGERAFGGWSEVDVDAVLRLQAAVDSTPAMARVAAARPGSAFGRSVGEYRSLLRALYRAILEVSGAQVVVDSSKRPSSAYLLADDPGVRLTVAHVMRDPRGVAHSFGKHVELPPGAALRDQMPRSTYLKVARRWVTVNAMVSALAARGVPVVRIRYEDLVADPVRHLDRVLRAEGRVPGPDGYPTVTEDGLLLGETHLVAGGRIRLGGGVMALRLDDAWRIDMPAAPRRVVTAVTAPARLAYGYR